MMKWILIAIEGECIARQPSMASQCIHLNWTASWVSDFSAFWKCETAIGRLAQMHSWNVLNSNVFQQLVWQNGTANKITNSQCLQVLLTNCLFSGAHVQDLLSCMGLYNIASPSHVLPWVQPCLVRIQSLSLEGRNTLSKSVHTIVLYWWVSGGRHFIRGPAPGGPQAVPHMSGYGFSPSSRSTSLSLHRMLVISAHVGDKFQRL